MHETKVTTRDGQIFRGYLRLFRPEEGFFELSLFPNFTLAVFRFEEVESAITEDERPGEEADEIKRAMRHMDDARRHNPDTPLMPWEKLHQQKDAIKFLCKRILEQWDKGGAQAMNQVFAHGEWAGLSVRELVQWAKMALGE